MKTDLTKLFRLLEITRSQPQYGYALAGIAKNELSDLAQHHYLVTMIAWQLGRLAIRAGAKIDITKVLEYSLIHDLGELFGGDISMPYAKANPVAREAAKKFEAENQKYIARLFGDDEAYFADLSEEIMDAQTDEGLIMKVADYVECSHYKLHIRRLTDKDIEMASQKFKTIAGKMTDPTARQAIETFVDDWIAELSKGNFDEFFEDSKAKVIT